MADDWRQESEDLKRTLSGLKLTSKGQLQYHNEVDNQSNDCGDFFYTLHSYFARSLEAQELIKNLDFQINESNSVVLTENTTDIKESESNNNSENEKYSKENNSRKIATSFENESEMFLKCYYNETRQIAEVNIEQRIHVFNRRTEGLYNDTIKEMKMRETELKRRNERIQTEMNERKKKDLVEMVKRKEKLEREMLEQRRKVEGILRKAMIEESHMVEEEQKRKEFLKKIKENIHSLYEQILCNVRVTQNRFKDFPYMSFITGESYQKVVAILKQVITETEEISKTIQDVDDVSLAEEYIKKMVILNEKMDDIDKKVSSNLESAKQHALKKQNEMLEQKKKAEKEKQMNKEVKAVSDVKKTDKDEIDKQRQKITHDNISCEKGLDPKTCVSKSAFKEYIRLQKVLKAMEESFKEFTSDAKYTKYKFDLHKAVNVPINALSAHSPDHLNDKIYRLVSLLAGKSVHIVGKTIDCNSHPSALAFCKNLVAKKLVMQGAQQVSSSPSSAFIYAAVIVGLWSAFPDVGELILAHFHRSYPYLVPYYMPKDDSQSSNEYYKALGYSIINEKVEDHDKFLKKLSGTVQLYAAILTLSDQSDHPHGIHHAWVWLARVLNTQPHPRATSTMLYHFLNTAGHVLIKTYGNQFKKLLLVLYKEFIPLLDKITEDEMRGPFQRLKDFLENCIKLGRIPLPEGYLTKQWWHSGHF